MLIDLVLMMKQNYTAREWWPTTQRCGFRVGRKNE
jgi:hypothetical protein